jgi:adenosine deaminase
MGPFSGDAEAVKQIAYEWCEDSAREGIVYSEVRYSPHFLASTMVKDGVTVISDELSPERVVQLVCEGLEEGSRDFKTKVRSILCCIYQCPGRLGFPIMYHGSHQI